MATTVSKHICDINKLYDYEKLGRCLLVPKYALEYFIIKKDVTKPMELANIFNVDYFVIEKRLKDLMWI